MSYQEDFFKSYLPYAKRASDALGIPVSSILSQWAWESAYGTSDVFKNNKNLAGIKYVGRDTQSYESPSGYAGYNSIDQFVNDYIRTMNNGYYDEVKSAISPEDTIYALGHSPWAETSYGGGENLIDVLKAYDLKKYDNMTSAANSDNPYGLNLDSIFNAVDNLTEQDKKTYAVVGAVSLAVFWAVKAFFDRQ